jgi:hypothetical protein
MIELEFVQLIFVVSIEYRLAMLVDKIYKFRKKKITVGIGRSGREIHFSGRFFISIR